VTQGSVPSELGITGAQLKTRGLEAVLIAVVLSLGLQAATAG